MSPLRRRMIDDMQIRNLTPNTQRVYVAETVQKVGGQAALRNGRRAQRSATA